MCSSDLLRWTAAAAALTLSLVIFADARVSRARADAQRLDAASAELSRDAARVEALRTANDGMQSVHDRIWRLESGYTPRWRMLAALSEATPGDAWVQRVELTDHDFVIDVEADSAAAVLRALEESDHLRNAQQPSGNQAMDGVSSRFRVMGAFDFAPRAQGGEGR